jgi:MarR family transcriptional regulator, 2-MHQ and catechol-resistance regulon repressor
MPDVLIQTNLRAKAAAKEAFLPLIRELIRAYQALHDYSAQNLRELGLTSPQFEVICTLANTPGMSMSKLGEQTLITKGTLTGIIDRLEQKGLVRREVPEENRRSFTIVLTPAGGRVFEEVFPAHTAYLKQRFEGLTPQDLIQMQAALKALRERF